MNKQPTAIIADDEPTLLAHLDDLLHRFWPGLTIIGKAQNGTEAKEMLLKLRPDIAFLDIRMPGLSGLQVARTAPASCKIVFVTAYDEYAVEAFEEAAIDYLLKPLNEKRLKKTIQRLKDRTAVIKHSDLLSSNKSLSRFSTDRKKLKWIRTKQGNSIKIIPVEQVYFFQAEDKYTKVVTGKNEYLIRTAIKQLREELDDDLFWCIHRSTIVNCLEIDSVTRSLSGRFVIKLKRHPQQLSASRRFGHLFKQM